MIDYNGNGAPSSKGAAPDSAYISTRSPNVPRSDRCRVGGGTLLACLRRFRTCPCPRCTADRNRMGGTSVEPTTTLLDSALNLACNGGLFVFPLVPGGKVPLTGHGFKDATRDPKAIRDWWMNEPNANIGVSTGASGVVVVDLDGPEGIASWSALCARHGYAQTLTSTTPRGTHLWFKAPATEVRNSASRLGPGIDVRAEGGYVVGPPSIRPEGTYRWSAWGSFMALPDWIVQELKPKPVEKPAIKTPVVAVNPGSPIGTLGGLIRTVVEAPVGQRNTILNWASYHAGEHIRAGRLPLESTVAALMEAGRGAGLGELEITKTIASALGEIGRAHV